MPLPQSTFCTKITYRSNPARPCTVEEGGQEAGPSTESNMKPVTTAEARKNMAELAEPRGLRRRALRGHPPRQGAGGHRARRGRDAPGAAPPCWRSATTRRRSRRSPSWARFRGTRSAGSWICRRGAPAMSLAHRAVAARGARRCARCLATNSARVAARHPSRRRAGPPPGWRGRPRRWRSRRASRCWCVWSTSPGRVWSW